MEYTLKLFKVIDRRCKMFLIANNVTEYKLNFNDDNIFEYKLYSKESLTDENITIINNYLKTNNFL
jgi:hypothetical protein